MPKQKGFTPLESPAPWGGDEYKFRFLFRKGGWVKAPPFLTGFTLVELLVVVAVIGLLITIIFVNVRDAQLKARDANIQENLFTVRKVAELGLGEDIVNYDVVCNDGDSTLSDTGDFDRLEAAIQENNNQQNITCLESVDKKAYALSSPLLYLSGHWCVDSAGASKFISDPITTAQCP